MATLLHTVREGFFGQTMNGASRLIGMNPPLFAYEEEKKGFRAPARYYKENQERPQRQNSEHSARSSSPTLVGEDERPAREKKDGDKEKRRDQDGKEQGDDPNLIKWEENDPHNPQNWSSGYKIFVTAELCFFTSADDAIYSPGIVSVEQQFGISQTAAVLGLSAFIAGYGISPMFLAPLSEIPQLGRNPIYIIGLILFVILQVPTALCGSLGALIPLRFLAGACGGPILATGGASIGDMYDQGKRAYAIAAWGAAAVCGPVLGPLLGGFASDAYDWRWTIWVLMMVSGTALLFLIFFLPETSAANILTRRARRLRRATGNTDLKTEAEIQSAETSPKDIAFEALARPFILNLEPIVFFCNLYIAFLYGLLYVWLESFAIVFTQGYGFNGGETGLAFMGIFICALLAVGGTWLWTYKVYEPALEREGDKLKPEIRMHLAMIGCWFIPISLFTYGWSANRTHWMAPIVFAGLFSVGIFLAFQSILNYTGDVYSEYQASIFAGNDLFRSAFGAGFPIFATAMYRNLGTAWASSTLAFLGLAFCPIPFVLYFYGERIRKHSKRATLKA